MVSDRIWRIQIGKKSNLTYLIGHGRVSGNDKLLIGSDMIARILIGSDTIWKGLGGIDTS